MSYKNTIGFKANNYGNIRYNSANKWVGQIGFETSKTGAKFAKFSDPVYGLRAIFGLIKTYQKRGANTISKIINIYAPSSENNTSGYIDSVSKITGISKDSVLNLLDSESMIKIVQAIVRIEIGYDIDYNTVKAAYNMLFKPEDTILTAANEHEGVAQVKKNGEINTIIFGLFAVIILVAYVYLKKH